MVDENVKRLLEFESDNPYKKYILDNPQDDPIIDQINKDFAMKDFRGKKAYMADKRAEMGEEEWGRILGEDDITRHAEKLKSLYYDMFQASGTDQKDFLQSIYDPEWDFDFGKMSDQQLIDFNKAEQAYEDADDRYRQRWDPESYPLQDPREDKRGNIVPRKGDLWDAVKGGGYDIWRDLYNMGTFGTASILDMVPFMNQTGAPAWLYDKMYQSHDDIFEHEADDMWMTDFAKSIGNELFVPSSVDKDNPYYDASQAWRIGGDATIGSLLAYLTKGRGIFGATNLLPKKGQKIAQQTFPYLSGKGTFWPPRKPDGSWYQRSIKEPSSIRNFGILAAVNTPQLLVGNHPFQAEAATISDDWERDSDPVVFDDVMTEKIQNFKPTPRGPGPWNEFEG